jgi:hypothetical protein
VAGEQVAGEEAGGGVHQAGVARLLQGAAHRLLAAVGAGQFDDAQRRLALRGLGEATSEMPR